MARPVRFTFIVALVAVGTALSAVGGWHYARASAPVNGPVILISIDSLRADHLPVYGYRGVATPAIDALARDGVVFERAYSHVPQTLPAHVALLTGRLPFDTGVRDNGSGVIDKGERLLAQMLHERGFATAGIVSTFLLRSGTGLGRGFDLYNAEMPPGPPDAMVRGLRRDGMESELIAEQWLDSVGTSRAFLFLQIDEPRRPYAPPEEFARFTPYDGEIAYADAILQRLIQHLKSRQLYDPSTIVLLSDHGEGLGDHGEQGHGLFVYDEALRVPLIIKQAAGEGAGRRITDVVQHVDIVPTVLDLAKAPLPDRLRGQSLKPLLEGDDFGPRLVYSESLFGRYHFGWGRLTSITDGRRRYISAPNEELYDLLRDPRQQNNLMATEGDAAAPLREGLRRLTDKAPTQASLAGSPEDREALAALGFVGSGVMNAAGPELPDADREDPKDQVVLLEQYREVVDLATAREWRKAMSLLQAMLHRQPDLSDGWAELGRIALAAGRNDQALDAFRRLSALTPDDERGALGAATSLLRLRRLDEAHQQAQAALDAIGPDDAAARFDAQELIARIALARRDEADARTAAEEARRADPNAPLSQYVEGRLLYDQSKYDEALPLFEQGLEAVSKPAGRQIAELHFYAAETLARLDRLDEAEREYLAEIEFFPQGTRARAALARLYQRTDRIDESAAIIDGILRVGRTPDAYDIAARLWISFGDKRRAAAIRAEGNRLFGVGSSPSTRAQ